MFNSLFQFLFLIQCKDLEVSLVCNHEFVNFVNFLNKNKRKKEYWAKPSQASSQAMYI